MTTRRHTLADAWLTSWGVTTGQVKARGTMTDASEDEPPLPADLRASLLARGLPAEGEVPLRRALEARLSGYSLFRLPPAAVKRWKARYRLLAEANYYDGQSPAEVYARALLACPPEADAAHS